jgi:hypothetical protein
MTGLKIFCCAVLMVTLLTTYADDNEGLLYASDSPSKNWPTGDLKVKNEIVDNSLLLSFPLVKEKQSAWITRSINGKVFKDDNRRFLVLELKAANAETAGQYIPISLDVSPQERYWGGFKIPNTDKWQKVIIALNGNPDKNQSLKFSPEISNEASERIKGLSFVRTPRPSVNEIPAIQFYLRKIVAASDEEVSKLYEPDKSEPRISSPVSDKTVIPPVSLLSLPVTIDKWQRPESKNGSFYKNGKPVFLTGINLASHNAMQVTAKKSDKIKDIVKDDPIYNKLLTPEILEGVGLQSYQINPVPQYLRFENPFISNPRLRENVKKLVCWDKWRAEGKRSMGLYDFLVNEYKANTEQMKLLEGTPVLPDFCPHFDTSDEAVGRVKDANLPMSMLNSLNGWVLAQDSPWCHSDAMGRELDNSYFKNGAYWLLSNGANPWVYEFWNELHYFNCTCENNQKLFLIWLQKRYGNINNLNKEWNTEFKAFSETVKISNYRQYRGLWADWMKFMGDRWQENIKNSELALREVDARPNTYVSWEISYASVFYPEQAADLYKGAMAVDCFGYEGGEVFGSPGLEMTQNVSLLDEIIYGFGGRSHSFYADMCRGLAPDKPIINFEGYISRRYKGIKDPQAVKRDDIITSLWSEAIHGVSVFETYVWWMHPKIDPEKADQSLLFLECSLLNPRIYPRNTLNGFKDFNKEMDKLGELILPRPRTKGIIAMMHSQPTVWQDPPVRKWTGQKYNVKEKTLTNYDALLLSQYPLDIIFEEHFRENRAFDYKAIVIPSLEHCYRETIPLLKEYVLQGGTLIVTGSGLMYDEYGKLNDCEEILGLIRKDVPDKTEDTFSVSFEPKEKVTIKTDCFNSITPGKAKAVFITEKNKRPCVMENSLGKGKVYYIAMESLSSKEYLALYCNILNRVGVKRPFRLESEEGNFMDNVEAQLIDRGDKKIFYMVNWAFPYSKIAKLFPRLPEGNTFYVTDIIADKALTCGDKATWTKDEIEKGIHVLLPPQTRTLIMVSALAWEHQKGLLPLKDMRLQLEESLKSEKKEYGNITQKTESIRNSSAQSEKERRDRQQFSDVNLKKCFTIDISKQVNMGFADETAMDKKGGWLDQGSNADLASLPTGKQVFSNVPFQVIDPKQNNGKSCLMLYSKIRDYFPEKVDGIPVGKKTGKLYFLQGSGYTSNEKIFKYTIKYNDETFAEVIVEGGRQISDWNDPQEVPDAKIGWEGSNPAFKKIGLYVFKWQNPSPEKTIDSISITSMKNQTVAGIIAITGEE